MRKLLFFLLMIVSNKGLLSQGIGLSNQNNSLTHNSSFSHDCYQMNDLSQNDKATEKKYIAPFGLYKPSNSKILSKLFLKLYAGYGFLTPGSYSVQSEKNFTYYDKNGDPHDTTVHGQGGKGVGGGFRLGGGIGYVLNDFLNVGVDVEYLMGEKLSNTLISSSSYTNFYATTNDQMTYNAITLSPYIIFKALAKPKYFVYNKLGVVFTLPYTLEASGNSSSSASYNWNTQVLDSSFKTSSQEASTYDGYYKVSLGIGFNVAFGINFRIGDNLRAFGELFGNFSALSPSSSLFNTTTNRLDSVYHDNNLSLNSYTEYSTVNTTYQQEGLAVKHLVSEADVPGGKSLTYEAQDKKFTINMNVIGISAGIIYRF